MGTFLLEALQSLHLADHCALGPLSVLHSRALPLQIVPRRQQDEI